MKFRIGDKVRVKSLDWYNENKDEDGNVRSDSSVAVFASDMEKLCGKVFTIRDIYHDVYCMKGTAFVLVDYMLEDDIVEDDVVKEPLDLTKILEGCEGIELWSPMVGKARLSNNICLDDENSYPIVIKAEYDNSFHTVTKDGYFFYNHDDTAEIMLYPSKEQRDWSKFKKPRWRAKDGEEYWYASDIDKIIHCTDFRDSTDNTRFEYGNYFRTQEEAERYAERIREIFKERL